MNAERRTTGSLTFRDNGLVLILMIGSPSSYSLGYLLRIVHGALLLGLHDFVGLWCVVLDCFLCYGLFLVDHCVLLD